MTSCTLGKGIYFQCDCRTKIAQNSNTTMAASAGAVVGERTGLLAGQRMEMLEVVMKNGNHERVIAREQICVLLLPH